MRLSISPVLLVSILFAAPATAQDGPKTPKQVLKEHDKNKDKKLSYEEFRGLSGNRYVFRQLDGDRDNFVTAKELAKRMVDGRIDVGMLVVLQSLEERAQVVDAVDFDANADGRIGVKEYRAWVFALADQNGDEVLDGPEADYLAMASPFNEQYYGEGVDLMKEYDRSNNGEVTASEFRLDTKWFKSLDYDRNGSLGADELVRRREGGLSAFANQDPDALIEKFDRDNDGALSTGEVPGGRGGLGRADSNQDGEISRDELNGALKRAQRYQFATIDPSFLERYDLNKDKRVSRAEYPGSATAFDRMDSNGDGYVSKGDGKR